MKTTKLMVALVMPVLLAVTAIAVAGDAKQGDGPTTKPVNKFCAIQGEPHEVVAGGGTAEHKGKTYGFCCEDCVAEFKKDPDKYAANAK